MSLSTANTTRRTGTNPKRNMNPNRTTAPNRQQHLKGRQQRRKPSGRQNPSGRRNPSGQQNPSGRRKQSGRRNLKRNTNLINRRRKDLKKRRRLQKQEKRNEEPLKGHHVINNDVRKIFRKIIDNFFEKIAGCFPQNPTFTQLVAERYISRSTVVYTRYTRPFGKADDKFIDETVADTPVGQHHNDPNDVQYSVHVNVLKVAVINYMVTLFMALVKNEVALHKLDIYGAYTAVSITGIVYRINTGNIYVDSQALSWWVAKGGSRRRYNEVRGKVAGMFKELSHTGGAVAITWVREIYHAYRAVINIRN